MRSALVVVLVSSSALAAAAPLGAPLEATVRALAKQSGATVAVSVELLERHQTDGVDASRAMPMASTFKLPLALVVMRAIERRELPGLDATVRLLPTDMLAGASPLYDRMPNGGTATMREVLGALLEASDNSAADALLRLAGGPARVTATLRALGLDGISIDRGEAEMMLDSHGVAHPPPSEWTARRIRELDGAVGDAQHRAALARFAADPRDHASPAAMTHLLARLWRGELLGPASTAFLQQEMARCTTGRNRLRAGVPAGTPVADRTGTCDGPGPDGADCANAAGVLTLPSGEHLVVAVYVAGGAAPFAAKEKLIADVARALWAEWVTTAVSRGR